VNEQNVGHAGVMLCVIQSSCGMFSTTFFLDQRARLDQYQ
jgi:hypothetical protein